jgi:hypothetical protein
VVLAILLTAGFLYWLYLQSGTVVDDVEPQTREEQSGEVVDLIPAQLMESPESLFGEEGVLRNVSVDESLGRGVVTVDLDGSSAYPVLLGPDIIARGTSLRGGDRVTVYGRVYALNDSIRGAWIDSEAVSSGNSDAIPTSRSFVLADSLTFN